MLVHIRTRAELEKGIKLKTGEPHRIVVGRIALARVLGKAFQKNKSFLMPGTTSGMRRVRELLKAREEAEVLVVGHCDTTGDDEVNDPLSLERAKNSIAFVQDDAAQWLAMYDSSVPAVRRWGSDEDALMLVVMPQLEGSDEEDEKETLIERYQRTRSLKVDGVMGPITRRKLIEEYMTRDGEPFAQLKLDMTFTAHGCGEHFPLDEEGRNVETNAPDDHDDALDRRVEFFLFDKANGIRPPPPGPNSKANSAEYPAWRKISNLAFETVIAEGEDDLFLRFDIDFARRAEFPDALRLFSSDGSFEQIRSIAKDGTAAGDFVDVVFTRVQTALSYGLEVTPVGEDPFLLFEDVPFGELGAIGEADDSTFSDDDPLAPEPESESDPS
jgi:hypothetical protein